MNQRRHVTLVAAAATLLTAIPLSTVFEAWTWLFDCVLAVGAIVAVALAVRSLRTPLLAQAGAMVAALLVMLTWLFPSGHEFIGMIPTTSTFRNFGELLTAAGQSMRDEAVPAPDRPGLLFLTTLGIGGVAILVDLAAVGLRRPALAGLPMLAIYSVPVAVHQESVSFIPFAVGALGFLWLLVTDNVDRVRRFGRRFTGDGRDVDLWEPSPLAAAGRRLGIIGVLVAILLPAAVPGMTSGLLDRFGSTGGGSGFGSGTAVNLFADFAGQLTRDRTTAMVKVETNDPSPYYLRLATADDLNRSGFRSRPTTGGKPANGPLGTMPAARDGTEKTYRATVTVLTLQMSFLPFYTRPTKMQGLDRSWLYDNSRNVLYSPRSSSRGKKYSFDFVRTTYSSDRLNRAQPLPADSPIQRQYTAVPDVPQVTTLVAELTEGKQTLYEKVKAIYDHFSPDNGFSYALSTRGGNAGTDVANFLTQKQGFCEQYAATMAWMVREAGIPARVALGFTRGNSKKGNTYTLTNRNLHAWTEVYFEGAGWVPFDPTPSGQVIGSVRTDYSPGAANPGGGTDLGEDDALVPGANGPSAGPNDPLDRGAIGPDSPLGPTDQPTDPWVLISIGAAALVVLLLAAPALYRASVRRRRVSRRGAARARAGPAPGSGADRATGPAGSAATPRPGAPVVVTAPMSVASTRREAHDAWDELLDTLIDYGVRLDDAETPRRLVERISVDQRLPAPAAAAVRLLGRAEERARYARAPLDGAELAASLRQVRRAVSGRASWRVRARARLLPPSVTSAWRAAVVNGFSGAVATTARWRDTVARFASVRRLLPSRAIAGGAGR